MAMYHLSAKALRRSGGRSAVAAAAYRAGELIVDHRTGVEHDYTRKSGVLGAELLLPGGSSEDRSSFWNSVEQHHKRKDSVTARELEVSLPHELDADQRRALALQFARELADRYGVAVDVALHAPRSISDRDLEKNPDQFHMTDPKTGLRYNGNWHAHLLFSACHVGTDGQLGKKAVELDPIHCQRHKIENMTDRERGRWCDLQNAALEKAQTAVRVDHRSFKDRGSDQEPTVHLGGYAARMRREGTPQLSENTTLNLEIIVANQAVDQLRGQLENEAQAEREAAEEKARQEAVARAEREAAEEKARQEAVAKAEREAAEEAARAQRHAERERELRKFELEREKERQAIESKRPISERLQSVYSNLCEMNQQIEQLTEARSQLPFLKFSERRKLKSEIENLSEKRDVQHAQYAQLWHQNESEKKAVAAQPNARDMLRQTADKIRKERPGAAAELEKPAEKPAPTATTHQQKPEQAAPARKPLGPRGPGMG